MASGYPGGRFSLGPKKIPPWLVFCRILPKIRLISLFETTGNLAAEEVMFSREAAASSINHQGKDYTAEIGSNYMNLNTVLVCQLRTYGNVHDAPQALWD
jgi:hypothetical protein